ncbi:uncharacterized protein [Henckelia pumila]|uniref:uncharacterized protein n=1 Tax=Henckelia pumila TaxID=405737 RepID=UPI003C6EA169
MAEQISSDAMLLFVKKFGRFMRKNHSNFQRANISSFKPKEPVEENRTCYNCVKEGHFIADCTKPKKDEKRTSYKKIFREERKRFRRKKEQKALLAYESNNKWAGSDSTSSDLETSSSESEDDAVKCLMANDSEFSDEGEVLDFTFDEFSKEDLINAINEMVNEYRILSHKFDEVRTNRKSSIDKSDQGNSNEYTESDSLKAQISLLMTENNDMRNKLTGMQKQAGDKSVLGYNINEGNSSISTTQSCLENNNSKCMKFVNKSELIKQAVWYLDSGCSRHMTGDKRMLSEYIPGPGPKITLGDNSKGISQKFWAEDVNTAYYTQNRSMIKKKVEKTPYEIWYGKVPEISYFKVFGCKCFINNNGKTHLTVLDVRSDAGLFLRYSSASKAYRVFNTKSLIVKESVHIVLMKHLSLMNLQD